MVDQRIILADSPGALVQFCGISALERLLRTLQRCGITRATVVSSTPEVIARQLAEPSWPRAQLSITVRSRPAGAVLIRQIVDLWPERAELLLVLRADFIFDPRLLKLITSHNEPAALVDSAVPARLEPLVASAPNTLCGKLCGAALLDRAWAATQTGSLEDALRKGLEGQTLAALDVADQPLYDISMRREIRPYWFPAPISAQRKLARKIFYDSIQKGTLDIPGFAHGPIETFLVSHLCRTSITPNQLTIFTNVVAWVATILFATGHLGWGLALALAVGVLDGLDGKQARVKVETTKSGKLEHVFDQFFEMSWWLALAYHFRSSGQLPAAFGYLLLLLSAEAIDGTLKWIVYATTGKLIDELGTFEWVVRLVGGRRNVYIWVLTIAFLLGAPGKGFVVMAWLQTATAAVHLPRILWALYSGRIKFS